VGRSGDPPHNLAVDDYTNAGEWQAKQFAYLLRRLADDRRRQRIGPGEQRRVLWLVAERRRTNTANEDTDLLGDE